MTPSQCTAAPHERILKVSEDAFVASVKAAMQLRRAPVAIVSTLDSDRPVGCAISAFLSLSLRPPSVLISMRSVSNTLRHIEASARFGLSLLADEHLSLIDIFSRGRPDDRFRSTRFSVVDGVPLVESAPAAFACMLSDRILVRDHTLLIGDIQHVKTATAPASSLTDSGQHQSRCEKARR